jgi:CRISPR-associated protein Cas1
MSSLYVDRRGVEMRLDSGAIAFYENGVRAGTVPAAPLERIYLRGDVAMSSGLLGRLGQMGIGVIILSGRRAEPSLFLPRPHNDASLRVAQTRLHLDAASALAVARWFIRGKIGAQAALVEEWLEMRRGDRAALLHARSALQNMAPQVSGKLDLDSLRGLEGAASAYHFKALAAVLPASLGFSGRNRRPPRDPVNAILSLGYTLLMAEAALAAHGHGFDPAIGFLHALDFGRPSFACDLAEPLRCVIDRFAWRLFSEQILRARDFTQEKDGACLLMKAAREHFYERVEEPLNEARKRLDGMLRAFREMILEVRDATSLPDRL